MTKNFNHLNGANEFPGLNVNPFEQYQNTFDYDRWNDNVKLTLYNVPWDADGRNAVIFDSVQARDDWFNSQKSKSLELTNSMFRNDPNGYIKLPLPFDEIFRYNYLSVDFGLATSKNNLVDYETSNSITKHFYFIKEAQSTTPTVSSVTLQEDFWTTFIYDAEIPLLMLERGHYPVAHSNLTKYLQSPIDNCEYLTADDINYGDTTVIKNQTLVPVETGDKYVLFSVPFNLNQLTNANPGSATGAASPPNFSDYNDATGFQANETVSYKFWNRSFSNCSVPCEKVATNDNLISNNLYTFAIKANEIYGPKQFMNQFAESYPHLFREIKSFFILGRDMFEITGNASFLNCTIYSVKSAKNIEVPITLNKSMFNFDYNISNIAKLYTYPYSTFEFTDINGVTNEIKPQNCSQLKIVKESCIDYPWLNITSFVTGVNGKGTGQISINQLDGSTSTGDIWQDDFLSFMSQFDIPTYAVNFSSYLNNEITNSVDMQKAERSEKTSYENTVRNLNQTYNNTLQSASTAQTNGNASADTAKTNTDNSADTTVSNASRSATNNTNNLNATVSANRAANSASITQTNLTVSNDIQLNSYLKNQDNTLSTNLTDANNAAALASNNNNIQTMEAQTGVSAATGIAGVIGNAMVGNVGEAINSAVGVANSAANCAIQAQGMSTNTNISISNNTQTTILTNAANDAKCSQQNISSMTKTGYANDLSTTSLNINIEKDTAITANNNATTIANTNASANTAKTNATNSQNTSKANNSRTYNTTVNNATNSRNTSINNRQRDAYTTYANAQNDFQKLQLGQNTTIASYSGDATPIADKRAMVRFSVRTQDKGAIKQTAAQFARYGYAYNGSIDLTNIQDFNQMKNFTYWKATEVWITGDKLIEDARDYIEMLLLNGVTIWKNPSEIGKVNPYAQF